MEGNPAYPTDNSGLFTNNIGEIIFEGRTMASNISAKGLVKNLMLWLDAETMQNWTNQTHTDKRGKPCVYTDQVIACALGLGAVYHLPLRATQGLLVSLVALTGVNVPVPDYSTLSRRRNMQQRQRQLLAGGNAS